MPLHRLFLIAPSLARLIQKERGGEHVREGYFPDPSHRGVFVQVEETKSSLVLGPGHPESAEEWANLPLAHGHALLAVAEGQVEYVRTRLVIGQHNIQLQRFLRPGLLDLVVVPTGPEEAEDRQPLPWFGVEVTENPAYQPRHLALHGQPDTAEVDLTNAALHSLIDLLENRDSSWSRKGEPPASPAEDGFQASSAPVPVADPDAAEEIDDPDIEDAVLRELARSLKPRR